MTLHVVNYVANDMNDAESIQKIDHYAIFACLKSESTWLADK